MGSEADIGSTGGVVGYIRRLRKGGVRLWKGAFQLQKRSGKIGVFLICTAVAGGLWYLSKLNHEYTVDVWLPISLVNNPPGKLLVGERHREIQLRVSGHGYTLLRMKRFRTELSLDLRSLWPYFTYDTGGMATFRGQQLSALINRQLPSGIQLDQLLSDSLRFQFSEQMSRRVPVESHLHYSVEELSMQTGPVRLSPDSVTVSGPRATLQNISSLPTEEVDVGVLRSTYEGVVALKHPNDVDVMPEQVQITVPTAQYTEKVLTMPVVLEGLPDTLVATLLPASVKLTCRVPIASYDSLTPSSMRLSVRYSSVELNIPLRVAVQQQPSWVQQVDFDPKSVSVFVERRP